MAKIFQKLKSITASTIDNSYDFEVDDTHRIIARQVGSLNSFYTSNCSHPDIIEFITAKQQSARLTKFNLSVNCTKEFMERVVKIESGIYGEEEIAELDVWHLRYPETSYAKYKKEWNGHLDEWETKGYPVKVYQTISVKWLWNLIMESTYNRAEPGVLFLDRANEYNPANYMERISATNPSMPAGTLVHTKSGIFPIENMENEKFQVKSLDGTWADAACFLSGENEPILKFKIGNLKYLRSTHQHRWPVYDQRMDRLYKVYASELKVGDLIPMNRNEPIGIYGDMSLTRDEGLLVGYLIGDGWFNLRKDSETGILVGGITFGRHEKFMAEKILSIVNSMCDSKLTLSERESEISFQFGSKEFSDILTNRYKIRPSVKEIPESVWNSNDEFIHGFIDGILSSDGSVFLNDSGQAVQLTTSREVLALDFAKLLSFAGIKASIYTSTVSDVSFPNGKKYDKEYTRWDVKITGGNLLNFFNVFGITHPDKASKLEDAASAVLRGVRYQRSREYVEIEKIEDDGVAKVWDISVYHEQHVFPSEWCYTGNCGEQTLAPAGVCCLGSLNLTQFVSGNKFNLSKIKKYVRYMVRFLDNVNEYSEAPLKEYVDSMKNKRRIGIGIMGWGSALFMMKTRFGSQDAAEIRDQLMETIAKTAYEASIDLAIEKGMFKYCDPMKHADGKFVQSIGLSDEYMNKLKTTGIRNSSLLSVQPTGNTGILANVVSGGLEPIFMPEYTRTVIVNVMPAEIESLTPRWYEGEWFETDLFKFVKEGDEEILRGVFNGLTYKIDKNRGLVKEVECVDYAVRYLRDRNEWNPTSDYVVTALSGLTADDHLNDLIGFTRWIDSAASKTINLPHEYSFEDFNKIYLKAYLAGHVKGVTTYRSGTMTSVLSSKENVTNGYDEEVILDNVKMNTSSEATMKTLKAEGRKWYMTVVWNETKTRPFALFVHTNNHEKTVTTHDAIELLFDLAISKNIPTEFVESAKGKIEADSNATKITRVLSLLLRHGVAIKAIVNTLDRVDNVIVGSFLFQIKKYLSSFIRDGEKVDDEKCLECGASNVVYQEGCKVCRTCGSSKCG